MLAARLEAMGIACSKADAVARQALFDASLHLLADLVHWESFSAQRRCEPQVPDGRPLALGSGRGLRRTLPMGGEAWPRSAEGHVKDC
jgi:hypothetical protein